MGPTAPWPRILVPSALVAVVLLLVAASLTPRATTLGINRPDLDRNPLAGRCWPLPTEHPSFARQLREYRSITDPEGGRRLVLTMQYDVADEQEVRAELDSLLAEAAFEPSTGGSYTREDYGTLALEVRQLEGVDATSIVRGTLVADLPAERLRGWKRVCADRRLRG